MESLRWIESEDHKPRPGELRARVWIALWCAAALVLLSLPGSAAASPAGSTFLVSRPDGTGTVPVPSDNHSNGPVAVSAEGRYVAFVSAADGFAPGANPDVLNVFVRDTVANTTTLASRSDGVNGAGVNANVEAGQEDSIAITVAPGNQVPDAPHDRPHVLVAFASAATDLVDHNDHAIPPTGGQQEVWLRDVTANTTYLVSRAQGSSGAPADGASSEPAIAAGPHGALVAFTSKSSNLAPVAPSPLVDEVFMRDVAVGNTAEASCYLRTCGLGAAQGESSEPSILYGRPRKSICGRELCALVAFTTTDPSIAPGAGPGRSQVVLARSVETPESRGFTRFSAFFPESVVGELPPEPANGSSFAPQVLSDASGVAFLSRATNLLIPELASSQPTAQGFFHFQGETLQGESSDNLELLTVYNNGFGVYLPNAPISDFSIARISPWDGVHTVYSTRADNLGVPSQIGVSQHAYTDFYPHLRFPKALDRAGGSEGAVGNANAWDPVISADASTAAFASGATNLGAGGGDDFTRIYLRHIDPAAPNSESLQLVSRPSGTGAFSPGSMRSEVKPRSTSADGRFVAFESDADNLSTADDNDVENVFVRDTVNGTTTLVSRATGAGGAGVKAGARLCGISEDGKRVAFVSGARNLDPLGESVVHAYVRDLPSQTTALVSRANGPSGTAVATGSGGCSISGDGDRIAFVAGPPLDPEAGNIVGHLYVRDLSEQTTIFVDRDNGLRGEPADAPALESALNRDGNRVAWATDAALAGAGANAGIGAGSRIYVRDIRAGTTVLASRADGVTGAEPNDESRAPVLNASGDVLAFESDATNLGPASSHRSIWVRRLSTTQTDLVSRASGANGAPADASSFGASIDAAGDRVAFVSVAGNLGGGRADAGGTDPSLGLQAYVRDLGARTTELVSRVNGAGGAPARPSSDGRVSISASGDCVAFAASGSNFTDLLSGSDFPQVRERVLRGSCGPGTASASGIAEAPAGAAEPALLKRMTMRPTRFFVGAGGGTQITFVLTEAAPIKVTIRRQPAAGSARTAMRKVGSVTLHGKAGRNTFHFSGRLRGHALAARRYRWTAAAPSGPVVSGSFLVVRHP